MRSDSSPRAVSMMMGRAAVLSSARSARQISRPFRPGSIKSRMTRSGRRLFGAGERPPAIGDGLGAVAGFFEVMRNQRRNIGVVFDDEHVEWRGHAVCKV